MFSFFRKSILVVEDSEPLMKAIKIKLDEFGFRVLTARSYSDAILHLGRERDLKAVWLDHYIIGDRSGLDVLAYMRRTTTRHRTTPVFVVSAIDDFSIKEHYKKLGVTKLYVKSEYQLCSIINEVDDILSGKINTTTLEDRVSAGEVKTSS